jgi:hypothetical protein
VRAGVARAFVSKTLRTEFGTFFRDSSPNSASRVEGKGGQGKVERSGTCPGAQAHDSGGGLRDPHAGAPGSPRR